MILAVVLGLFFMLGLDYIWLHLVMADMYHKTFSEILLMQDGKLQIRMLAAVIDYLLIYLATIVFAVRIGTKQTLPKTLGLGFLLGFCLYGVYDMTSLALFKYWTWHVAIVDCIWGGVLVALVSVFVRYLYQLRQT